MQAYEVLRARIVSGALPEGSRLPSYPALARSFGVSSMTMRSALRRLAAEGLITIQVGVGTRIGSGARPAILIIEADDDASDALGRMLAAAGMPTVAASSESEAVQVLESDTRLLMAFLSIHFPTVDDGLRMFSLIAKRRPGMPVVAMVRGAVDYDLLHSLPEGPVLIASRPPQAGQLRRLLQMARLGSAIVAADAAEPQRLELSGPALIADTSAADRARSARMLELAGIATREIATGAEMLRALAREYVSLVLINPALPGAGPGVLAAAASAYPETLFILTIGEDDALPNADGLAVVLGKPFEAEALADALRLRRLRPG